MHAESNPLPSGPAWRWKMPPACFTALVFALIFSIVVGLQNGDLQILKTNSCRVPGDASCAPGIEWILGLSSETRRPYSIGEAKFNENFQGNPVSIIKRVCPTCLPGHQTVFYRRLSDPSSFRPFYYMVSDLSQWPLSPRMICALCWLGL